MEKRSDRVEAPTAAAAVKKDRHIVSWSPEEDELLREQVSIHGADGWTSIAAKFKDKTARQCRRRWFTYLSTESKKGGWSAEEDLLLCEAQRVLGNRWTEIAKVVSGRTDNAVKNRFSTLCKKRAKLEASTKENNGSNTDSNNKRAMFQKNNAMAVESSAPSKETREQDIRPPLAEVVQNFNAICSLPVHPRVHNKQNEDICHALKNKVKGSFLKKDDPRIGALLQQAELLSSLAVKVSVENTKQSLEDAWKEVQDYLLHSEQTNFFTNKISLMDFQLDDFRDLIEELRCETSGDQPSGRKSELHDVSLASAECSTGSTEHSNALTNKNHQHDDCSSNADAEVRCHLEDVPCSSSDQGLQTAVGVKSTEEPKDNNGHDYTLPDSEFGSPVQMIPLFQSFGEGIPSPKFSTSERKFLLSVLSMPSPAPGPNSSQMPSCKRALLNSLSSA